MVMRMVREGGFLETGNPAAFYVISILLSRGNDLSLDCDCGFNFPIVRFSGAG
jgi:hypothetical protein